ncbi:hypothetical protein BD413DRAFT_580080 [Trametes elegans]|nr:hypothetical protein BD413DRAFT_580080 [Trametes elegans]
MLVGLARFSFSLWYCLRDTSSFEMRRALWRAALRPFRHPNRPLWWASLDRSSAAANEDTIGADVLFRVVNGKVHMRCSVVDASTPLIASSRASSCQAQNGCR